VSFSVIIPARFASTRLPGKPLLDIAGRPMIRHVWERACRSSAARVVIATDDERILDAARGFGAETCLTGTHHQSGTDRLQEAVAALGLGSDEIVVNVQGDEPLIPPAVIDQVAANLAANRAHGIATLCEEIAVIGHFMDPNVVKVVRADDGSALYFSRAPIPWPRDAFARSREQLPPGLRAYRHIGIYAYRAGFLRQFPALEPAPIETSEALEQLRALWHGHRIAVHVTRDAPGPGVDTPEDLARVRRLYDR